MNNTTLHFGHSLHGVRPEVVTYVTRRWPSNKDSADPNEIWRPWLEEHIGKQNIDWDWTLKPDEFNIIEISFVDSLNATLFELKW